VHSVENPAPGGGFSTLCGAAHGQGAVISSALTLSLSRLAARRAVGLTLALVPPRDSWSLPKLPFVSKP
jgi:hypothetical protein